MARTDAAIQQLQAAEKIKPSSPDVYDQLALLFRKNGQQELAQKERIEAAEFRSRANGQAEAAELNAQANESLARGNARAAADAYRKALRLDPSNPRLHYNLSLALDKLGDQA